MVMNLNISADDINSFENANTMAKFCQIFMLFMLPVKLFITDKVFVAISPLEEPIVAKI